MKIEVKHSIEMEYTIEKRHYDVYSVSFKFESFPRMADAILFAEFIKGLMLANAAAMKKHMETVK